MLRYLLPMAAFPISSMILGLVLAVGGIATLLATSNSGPGGPVLETLTTVSEPGLPQAHNSPSVAVHPADPKTLVVASRRDAPTFGCELGASADGGASWSAVPLSAGLAAVDCFWPRVAFLPGGDLLVLYTPLGGPYLLPVGVWLQRYEGSPTGLRPAGEPVAIAGAQAYFARLAVSGQAVWSTWVNGPTSTENALGLSPGDNHIAVSRSDDGGRSWGRPVRVSEADRRVIQPTVLAWNEGGREVVLVGALDLADDILNYGALHDGQTPPDPNLRWRVMSWVSTDGGGSFGPAVAVADNLAVPQLIIADLGPTPGFARDPASGRLYATWDAGRGNDRDVSLATSDDGGRNWSAPKAVGPQGGSQHLPAVAVAPDGRVDVVYYDRGRHPQDLYAEAVLATSTDGGETFRVVPLGDRLFDTGVGLGMQQGVAVLGDHLAVVAQEGRSVAFWADTSRGTALVENIQDLAVAVVEHRDPESGRSGGAAVAGAGLILAGAIVVLAGTRRRSRR